MDELTAQQTAAAELRLEVSKLRTELDATRPQRDENAKETEEEAMSAAGAAKSQNRKELQRQLEVALFALTELEESGRMEKAIQDAVASGLVKSPIVMRRMGECALCLQDIPELQRWDESSKYGRYWCCGAVCCAKCFVDSDRHCQKALDALVNGRTGQPVTYADPREVETRVKELNRMNRCPFCRTDLNVSPEAYVKRIQEHAEANKDWAQYEMADRCLQNIPVNARPGEAAANDPIRQCVDWLEQAAALGNIMARGRLGEMMYNGGNSTEFLRRDYLRPAAQSGHVMAQYLCAVYAQKEGSHAEAVQWCLLSAGQGFPQAEGMMGQMCLEGCRSSSKSGKGDKDVLVPKSVFAAIVWLRKAAMQGDFMAQGRLASAVLQAKREIFDGVVNNVGYSAVPESVFWQEQMEESMKRRNQAFDNTPIAFTICGCCERGNEARKDDPSFKVKRCTRCRSIAYCGRDCQAKHWAMGHKVDCKGVDALRKLMKASTSKPSPRDFKGKFPAGWTSK